MKRYYNNFIKTYKGSLLGKKIALFGATGGIGYELCRLILSLGGTLVTVDRNPQKSLSLSEKLKADFKDAEIHSLIADLEDIDSINAVLLELKNLDIDTIIHNAGAYAIKRKTLSTNLDNVFQINFLAPYYITKQLLPHLRNKKGRVIAVGSIAHNYSKTDKNDIEFRNKNKSSLVYGNAKRYLMYSLLELFKNEKDVSLAVTHPGITFTNITAHYPKIIFAIIKRPMKIIFMKPKYAAISIIKGLFIDTPAYSWLGPRLFNVWGKPTVKPLKTANKEEIEHIFTTAEKVYQNITKNY